jgi:transcription-repair coupling factor (superfamily II helicase)
MDAPELRELAGAVAGDRPTVVSGLWGSSVAAVAAAIGNQGERPVLLVCGHVDEADDLADDAELFSGERPEVLPALETAGGLGQASEELVADRLRLLRRLTDGKAGRFAVASVQALMQAVPDPAELKHLSRLVRPGQEIEPEKLIVWLSDHGYNRLDQVEVPGDFAVRGGILDVYLPGKFETADDSGLMQIGLPVRIDFFGDQIETIKRFNIDTLGSEGSMDAAELVDLRGRLDDGATTSPLKYIPQDSAVVLWAPLEIAEQAKAYLTRAPDQRGLYPLASVLKLIGDRPVVEASQFESGGVSLVSGGEPRVFKLPVRSLQKFETEPKKALLELAELSTTHEVAVFCDNSGEQTRFCELLDAEAPGACDRIETPVGYLHRGFAFGREEGGGQKEEESVSAPSAFLPPPSSLLLLGHHELFHRYELRRRVKNKGVATKQIDSFLDLNVGDYVVHVAHGIAKFTGMQTMEKEGRTEEYLTLRFAENAALYVPASRINLIQKYVGGFSGHPTLSRLGGTAWEKQKEKVGEAVMDMAAELLEVQAKRAAQVGHPFPADTDWQQEFEAEFPYTPTDDQLTAADEIKGDMVQPRPMDRLLCGDVGYGKTEMAMRAAFKAIEAGKQVAVLVPTTVLAEQHERSFRERMRAYPFRIESLSRFKKASQSKLILEALAAGEVDVVIGTHKLLGKGVVFRDLGLLVIDEEQRFGVTHKEKLKQLRTQVDILTMSATPIPRTLHMGMVGLRDISSLTTPPQDRRAIVTEVLAYDEQRVRLALLRELQREGQVYYVHNKVYDIEEQAAKIQAMVPEARILVGHGQMEEGALEKVMLKFIRHEADILVSTTIIESGLDIPNANTMFINGADRFGLSELHQLRGRVGRYKHRAYCYLLLPPDRPVTEVAAKRLKAIEEFSHLGSGFKIAMRDLELRGAGNILGAEQSGHIAAVGYEMYCQLLEEATRQLKDEPNPTKPEALVEIDVAAFIPKTYVQNDRQRMDLYRRLTRCTSIEEITALRQDVLDAFGEPPRQMEIVYALTELRLLASHFGIARIVRNKPDVVLSVDDAAKAQTALTGAPGTLRVVDAKTVYFRPPAVFIEPEPLLLTLRNLLLKHYEAERSASN